MKSKIVTYEVPCSKDLKGLMTYDEANRKVLGEPEWVSLDDNAHIGKIATEISQENTRVRRVAEAMISNGKSSTVNLKYLE